jgi:hypothetical protein
MSQRSTDFGDEKGPYKYRSILSAVFGAITHVPGELHAPDAANIHFCAKSADLDILSGWFF